MIVKLKATLKNKKVVIGGGIVGVFFLLFIVMRGCSGSLPEVKVGEVTTGRILNTISSSGLVRSNSVKLGAATMSGRVDWVAVEEGDRVSRGQVLVKLDGYDQARKEYNRLKKLHAQGYVSDSELERAKTMVNNVAIIAPISGIVSEKAVIPGEAVSPGVPVMTVVDIDNPWLEIQIDEVDIAKVAVGQKVKFSTDAYQDESFIATITWINKKAELKKVGGRVRMDEEDLVFRGKAKFTDGKGKLRPGMSVYAEVIIGEKNNVIVVPRSAVTLKGGKRIVYRLLGKKAKLTELEIGLKDAEQVEVLKGLSVGQKVAISNLDKIKDGKKVKIK